MGLDMYLTKKTYVKNWEHIKEKHKISVRRKGKTIKNIKPERITYIEEEMGYWRKANAIHKWFVDNVQEGEDDCKPYYVTEEQLEDLLSRVDKILKSVKLIDGKIADGYSYDEKGNKVYKMIDGKVIDKPEICDKYLPCEEGFFFGSTDYDEYYYQDLLDTKTILKGVLEELKVSDVISDIYYDSSW